MDIRFRELGAKIPLNGTSKSEQTDKDTDRQTHIWTFRLIESIGPEGQCFENKPFTRRTEWGKKEWYLLVHDIETNP